MNTKGPSIITNTAPIISTLANVDDRIGGKYSTKTANGVKTLT